MPVASLVSKRTQIARESVIGTRVQPNRFLGDLNIRLMPNNTRGSVRPSGSTMETDSPLIQNWTAFSLETGSHLGYETSYYLFAALMGLPTTATPGGGVNSREHTFVYAADGLNTRPSFTMAAGYRGISAEEAVRCRFDSFGFGFSRTADATISGGGFGQDPDLSARLEATEVNTLTIDATGGDYTLTVQVGSGTPDTTAAIAENAAASAVQSALEALDNVAPGDVVVTGSAGGPYTITWAATLAYTDITLTADDSGLTGGASTATVATTQAGGLSGVTTVQSKPVQAPEWAIFIDAEGGTIGTTRYKAYSAEFAFTGLITPDWVVDDSIDSYDDEVLQVPTLTLNLVLRNDSASRTLWSNFMAGQRKLVRLRAIGDNIEGSLDYELRLDALCAPADNIGQFGDNSGAETMPFPMKIISDPDHFSGGFRAFLRNTVTDF